MPEDLVGFAERPEAAPYAKVNNSRIVPSFGA